MLLMSLLAVTVMMMLLAIVMKVMMKLMRLVAMLRASRRQVAHCWKESSQANRR